MHIGTKLDKRLARGDRGINPLDDACKEHDIAYRDFKEDLEQRHHADKILQKAAWQRVKASDASLGEKAAAVAISAIMKTKRKLGMGDASIRSRSRGRKMGRAMNLSMKYRKRQNNIARAQAKLSAKRERGSLVIRRGRGMKRSSRSKNNKNTRNRKISFNGGVVNRIAGAIAGVSAHDSDTDKKLKQLVGRVVGAAKRVIKQVGGKKNIQIPRTIELPKTGGILPLIPIFSALGALGGIAGGIGSIVKAVKSSEYAKKQYVEGSRHNKMMEAIAMGAKKTGTALYLRPYRKGHALFLKPYSKLSTASSKN